MLQKKQLKSHELWKAKGSFGKVFFALNMHHALPFPKNNDTVNVVSFVSNDQYFTASKWVYQYSESHGYSELLP